MASEKLRKIAKIVKEITIEPSQSRYDISGLSIELCKFFYRKPQELFQDLSSGDYTIDTSNESKTLVIQNPEILKIAEAIQICYVVDLTSSRYEAEFNVDINKLNSNYNQLVDDVHTLWEYVKKVGMIADDTTIPLILPQLNTDEVWVKTEDGYKGISLTDAEGIIKGVIEEYTALMEKRLDAYVEDPLKPRLNEHVETVNKPELDRYVEETNKPALDDYTTQLEERLQTMIDQAVADKGLMPEGSDWLEIGLGNWLVTDLFNKNYTNYPPQLNSSDNAGVVKKDITDGSKSQVIRFYTTTGKMLFIVRVNEVWSEWQELGEQTDTMQFTQVNHGFIFTAVTLDGATRQWVKANKYTSADGIAIKIDNDRFDVVTRGVVNIPTQARDDKGEPFVYDEYYFLSQEVDGGLSRTKNEVGTFQYLAHISEIDNKQVAYIDIGDSYDLDYEVVDTETADRVGIGTYKTTLRTADTIEDLKRLNLKVGDVVEVLGYYTAGDGAGHKRVIASAKKSFNSIMLDNGLYANLISNKDIKNIILKKENTYPNASYMGKFDIVSNVDKFLSVIKDVDGYKFSYDEKVFGTSFDTVYIDVNAINTGTGNSISYPISLKQLKTNLSSGIYKNKGIYIYILNDLITYEHLCGELTFGAKKVRIKSLAKGGTWITTYKKPSLSRTEQDGKVLVYDISSYETVISHLVEQTTLDDFGVPKVLLKVEREEDLVSGTYYISGTEVKVMPFLLGANTENNIYLVIKVEREQGLSFLINGEYTLIENINFFIHQYATASCWIKGSTTIFPVIMLKDCKFLGGEQDSLGLSNQYIVVCDNCIGTYASKDCFNYHTTSKNSVAIEVNCIGYNAGGNYKSPTGNQTGHSNNATTAHDGMTVMRFGSIGFNCEGPVLADVNGCRSINYDCFMENSITVKGYNANYHFQAQSENYNEFVLICCYNGKIWGKGEIQNKGVHILGDCNFISDLNENILEDIDINDVSLVNVYKVGVVNE